MTLARPINTRLTSRLNIQTPIVSAAMAIPGINSIAATVTSAGGYGFIGTGLDDVDQLKGTMDSIRETLRVPVEAPLPVGVGFLGWVLDGVECPEYRIITVLEQRPHALWFSFGENLEKYIRFVQDFDSKREHKTLIFVMINTIEEALRAANEWKVDALVVQGIEAGGHGSAHAPPLFDLLPAILEAVPNGPLIIAAGGIATGTQIAALLTLGADGVALGTRFLFTSECALAPHKKDMLLEADLHSTARAYAYDEVTKLTSWPKGCDGRAIKNKIVSDAEEGSSVEERVKKYEESERKNEKDRAVVWAGTGVGLTKDVKSCWDVVRDLHEGAVSALQAAASLLS